MSLSENKSYQIVKKLYKNQWGRPFELSEKQVQLFEIIAQRKNKNNQIITFTQWGKSEITSLALLTRVTTFPEKWILIAPALKKARIIMSYLIGHIFDNEYTAQSFQIGEGESREKIQRERSKTRLTFRIEGKGLGEVMILSTQETRRENPLDAMMGFGASSVIIDESSLIEDTKYTGILRMLGATPDPFILEIGNPFRRNHFFTTSKDPTYCHLVVDYVQGLNEGRITQEQVDRMLSRKFFDVLYECKFPVAGQIDAEGWIPLLTPDEIEQAQNRVVQSWGTKRMGVDVAEGGDENVFVVRTNNKAYIKHRDHNPDLMATTGKIISIAKDENIKAEDISVDAIGDGAGVVARLHEQRFLVQAVKGGTSADAPKEFFNLRSQYYWNMRNWIREGGALERDDGWDELLELKYRAIDSTGKIQMIPKTELLGNGIASPNIADAFAMSFTNYNRTQLAEKKTDVFKLMKDRDRQRSRKTRAAI